MSRPEPAARALVFSVSGMHCASCGLLIDDTVEELAEVAASQTHVPSARTVVTLAGPQAAGRDEIAERIVAAIAEAGYPAHPVA